MLLPEEIFKRDVLGGFEVNPKEIRLSPLSWPAKDRREQERCMLAFKDDRADGGAA